MPQAIPDDVWDAFEALVRASGEASTPWLRATSAGSCSSISVSTSEISWAAVRATV